MGEGCELSIEFASKFETGCINQISGAVSEGERKDLKGLFEN